MGDEKHFRDYNNVDPIVIKTYEHNHANQTVDYVKKQIEKHCTKFDKCKMTLWQALYKLDNIIDESDPDLSLSQFEHAFQTAEGLKKLYPDEEQIHLIGLIHDAGKILLLPEFGNLPQWSVVGDTFPVGCLHSKKIIYSEFFKENIDNKNPIYSTKYGTYEQNCGLDNIIFSFSHDNYLYDVCKHNKCLIDDDFLKIIKYHSAYVIHKENEYEYLLNDDDFKIRDLCKQFSYSDLYNKDNNKINIQELFPYYDKLIKKYFPNEFLDW